MKPLAAALAFLLALTTTLRSQDPADSDLSFGSNGVVVAGNVGTPQGGVVAIDSQGRIVVAGSSFSVLGARQIIVIRYQSNGRLDASFGSGGRSILPLQPLMNSATAVAVAIDAADNIVLAGESDAGIGIMLVTRVLGVGPGAGTLDPAFGGGGYVGIASFDQANNVTNSRAAALAIDGAGRIVVAGTAFNPAPVNSGTLDLMVHRLNPDGSSDNTFSGGLSTFIDNGGADEATGVAIDGVGRIFVSSVLGNGATVNRITAAGLPDPSIGPSGRLQLFDSVNMLGNQIVSTGIATDSTNHVVVCGSQTGGSVPGTRKLWLARFAPNSVNSDWIVQENFEGDVERVEAIAIGTDRNIVVAGRSSNGPGVAVIRYLPTGQRDTSFNNPFGGFADRLTDGANESARGVAIERSGAIVVSGTNDVAFFAARFGFPVLAGPGRVNLRTTRVRSSSRSIQVPVRNAGNVPMTGLRVRALGLQRRDFVVRQPLSRVLAPGERTTFLVRFRPRASGLRTATLQISTREGLTRDLQARGKGVGAG